MERGLVKIYLILDIFIIVISLLIGNFWLLNTQISFFLTMLIAFVSIRSYKKLINKELHSGKYDDLEEDEIIEVGKFRNSATLFSPIKFLVYGLLGLCVYLLAKFETLNVLAFLVGAMPYPIGALIYGVMSDKKNH